MNFDIGAVCVCGCRWVEVSHYRTTSTLSLPLSGMGGVSYTHNNELYIPHFSVPNEVGAFQLGMRKEAVRWSQFHSMVEPCSSVTEKIYCVCGWHISQLALHCFITVKGFQERRNNILYCVFICTFKPVSIWFENSFITVLVHTHTMYTCTYVHTRCASSAINTIL